MIAKKLKVNTVSIFWWTYHSIQPCFSTYKNSIVFKIYFAIKINGFKFRPRASYRPCDLNL